MSIFNFNKKLNIECESSATARLMIFLTNKIITQMVFIIVNIAGSYF